MDHQVAILHVDRDFCAFAANGIGQRFADVEIQRVAEFIGTRDTARFDAGGKIAGIVAAEAAAAERTQQILKSLEAEKIDGLVRDFESYFAIALLRLTDGPARGGLRRRSHLRRL